MCNGDWSGSRNRSWISSRTYPHLINTSCTGRLFSEYTIAMFGTMFRVQMNEEALVPYTFSTLPDNDLAIKIAGRLNFPDAENLYTAEFKELMTSKEVIVVAKLIVSSNTSLRTPATIVRF